MEVLTGEAEGWRSLVDIIRLTSLYEHQLHRWQTSESIDRPTHSHRTPPFHITLLSELCSFSIQRKRSLRSNEVQVCRKPINA